MCDTNRNWFVSHVFSQHWGKSFTLTVNLLHFYANSQQVIADKHKKNYKAIARRFLVQRLFCNSFYPARPRNLQIHCHQVRRHISFLLNSCYIMSNMVDNSWVEIMEVEFSLIRNSNKKEYSLEEKMKSGLRTSCNLNSLVLEVLIYKPTLSPILT